MCGTDMGMIPIELEEDGANDSGAVTTTTRSNDSGAATTATTTAATTAETTATRTATKGGVAMRKSATAAVVTAAVADVLIATAPCVVVLVAVVLTAVAALVVAVVTAPESFDLVLVVAAPESLAPSSSIAFPTTWMLTGTNMMPISSRSLSHPRCRIAEALILASCWSLSTSMLLGT